MKHSWLKRALCLLLAAQCVLSIPASTLLEAAAVEAYNAGEAEADVFSTEGVAEADDTETVEAVSEEEEPVVSYVDIEGNYNAPEELTVYITSLLGKGKVEQLSAESKYTGVAAFYDYNNDRARENPYFFYYKEGKLQKDEAVCLTAQGYLDLVNPPVSASVVDPGANNGDEKVYAAEEVYVDAQAAEHADYLFAFNQKDAVNGLYTGEKDGVNYVAGLAQAAESTAAAQQPGEAAEAETTPEETPEQAPEADVERAVPTTTISLRAEGIEVKWTKDKTAAGYRILRKADGDLDWTIAADLDGGDQDSYMDTQASSNDTYIYAVRSYFGEKSGTEREDMSTNLWSDFSQSSSLYYLAAPVLTDVYDANPGLTLKWSKVSGATDYRVFRKTEGSGWKTLTTVKSTQLTYTDKTAVVGTKYLYTVRALNGSKSGWYYDYTDDLSKYVCSHTVPTVKLSSTTEGEESGILVSWTKDVTATGYRIFRKSEDQKSWTVLTDVKSGSTGSFFDSQVNSGKKYTYAVRAYYGEGDIAANTAYSTNVWSGYTASSWYYYLQAPTVTAAVSAADGMSITWTPVSGASSYRIYRKTEGSGWKNMGTVTGANAKTYLDKTAVGDTAYYYTVRAYKDTLSSWYITPEKSVVFHAALAITAENMTSDQSGIILSWTKPAGAAGYRIFRKAKGQTSWTTLADLTEASFETAAGSKRTFIDENVAHGTVYTYAVRAYFGQENIAAVKTYGDNLWCAYKAVTLTCVGAPELGAVSSAATGMQVTWTPVSGASAYRIYRKTASSGWKMIGKVTGQKTKQYIDTTAVGGTEYFYSVRAEVTADGKTTLSGYETPEKGYVFHAAPVVTITNTNSGMHLSWGADSKATGYRIFRKLSGETAWTVVANLDGAATAYDEIGLTSGKKATYAVRAYYGTEDVLSVQNYGNNTWSAYVAKSCTYLSVPELNPKACPNEDVGIKVTWERVTGASGYAIWRKDMSVTTPKWVKVGTVTGGNVTSYIDGKSLVEGHKYYYTVRATAADGSVSAYDPTGAVSQYLPAVKNVFVDVPSSSGTKITWTAMSGVSQYVVRRKTVNGAWTDIATTTTNSYTDTSVKNKKTTYYYTVRAVMDAEVDGVPYSIYGSYDNTGVTFAVKWSGSERGTWVLKSGKQYYVNSKGYCLTGWQYIKRYGTEYKYYFDLETGALCTNLYQKFGSSYADLRCKYVVNLNNKSSNPSTTTILLYDAEKEAYNTPAISVRCIGSFEKTLKGNYYLRKATGQRWLNSDGLGGDWEQYAVFIRGSYSWFHSSIYNTTSAKNFRYQTYRTLVGNSNSTNGCIRLQCIYNYLICDIQKNGYGAYHDTVVTIYHKRSAKAPFGVPRLDGCGSSRTEPTDPAITGKFFYATKVFGVSTKSGAKTWTYYDTI